MQRWGWWALLVCLLGMTAPVSADVRYFTYTYDWFTPVKNEKEVELYWTQSNGGNAEGQFEFEYAPTDCWVIAPYLLFSREHGGEMNVEGWKLEQRYRFGKYGRNRFLPAAYLEVAKENGSPFELEGKFITSYLFGDAWLWSSNLILEQKISGHDPLEFAYAEGVSHSLSRQWQLGVETFGNFHDKEHFFGPAIRYTFDNSTRLLATVGCRYAGPEGGAVRLLFEKEWR